MIEIKYNDGRIEKKECTISQWLEENGYGTRWEGEGYGDYDYLECLLGGGTPWEKDFGIDSIRELIDE